MPRKPTIFFLLSLALWAQEGASPYVPVPNITAVVNSADGSYVIAPNTWVTIYGSNLTFPNDARSWQTSDFINGQMPMSLDGVWVYLGSSAAYVSYISPTQINILTPPDMNGGTLGGGLNVRVTYVGVGAAIPGCSNLITLNGPYDGLCYNSWGPCVSGQGCDGVRVGFVSNELPFNSFSPVSPALFTLDGVVAIAEHANGTLVNNASPASPGEEIVLYAEGLGAVSPPVVPGSAVQKGTLVKPTVVTIGGVPAIVSFAGLVSPGLYQVNVVVPQHAAPGMNTLAVIAQGSSSQPGVLLMVQ